MRRQVEVNYYEHRPQGQISPQVLLLCEPCREQLTGRVTVLRYGAESDQPKLACERCGYTMVAGPQDPRWRRPAWPPEHDNPGSQQTQPANRHKPPPRTTEEETASEWEVVDNRLQPAR